MSAVNDPTVTTQDKDEVKSAVGSNSGEETKSEDPTPDPKPIIDEPATSSTKEDSASKAKAAEAPKPAPVSFANPQIATQEVPKPVAVWGQPEPSASGSKHAEHEDGDEGAKGDDPSVSPQLFYTSISNHHQHPRLIHPITNSQYVYQLIMGKIDSLSFLHRSSNPKPNSCLSCA